jgi:hypothetical protein
MIIMEQLWISRYGSLRWLPGLERNASEWNHSPSQRRSRFHKLTQKPNARLPPAPTEFATRKLLRTMLQHLRQLTDEIGKPHLSPPPQAFRDKYRLDFGVGTADVVIDDDVVILRPVADLVGGLGHALGDG